MSPFKQPPQKTQVTLPLKSSWSEFGHMAVLDTKEAGKYSFCSGRQNAQLKIEVLSKSYILYDSIYINSQNGGIIEVDNRLMVARGWRMGRKGFDSGYQRATRARPCDGAVLCPDCGGGHTNLYV